MALTAVRALPIKEPFWRRFFKRDREAPGAPPIPYIRQEQDNWCWAACCEMIVRGMGFGQIRQCDMASKRSGSACCATPDSHECDQGAWPEVEYVKHGVDLDPQNMAVSLEVVRGELDRGCPVEVYYAWTAGGAHVALIVEQLGGDRYRVHDPWYGSAVRTYDDILSGYGMGQWTSSYINIRRRNG